MNEKKGEQAMKRRYAKGLVLFIFLALVGAGHPGPKLASILASGRGFEPQRRFRQFRFNTDTSFVYGLRAGVRVLMLAAELSYVQAAHNLDPKGGFLPSWKDRTVDWSLIALNAKLRFPILILAPYITAGYGYYGVDIQDIQEESTRKGGFNLGAGVELSLGSKFALVAEGKYHYVKVDVEEAAFKSSSFTLTGGFNISF
jgi:opacity protein-like surface antigen